jgi:hypothetical protein
MLVTKEAILGVQDVQVEQVWVEPWHDYVYVRVMSARERDNFELSFIATRRTEGDQQIEDASERRAALANFRARLVSLTLCDDKGARIFTEADVVDLGRKSGLALDIIAEAAKKLNGITKENEKAIVKNSASVPEGSGNSDSP